MVETKIESGLWSPKILRAEMPFQKELSGLIHGLPPN